jgi:predicted  nucleic acid-binding Zn-ribbon protein
VDVHPDLESLLALQERDLAVAAVEKDLEALLPEEAVLDAELEGQAKALDEAQRAVTAAETRRVELEARIAGYKQMQERRRQQLEYVRGAKEASTMMAEIDLARGVLVKEEAEFVRSADWVLEAEKKVKDQAKAHAAVVAQQEEARAVLAEKRAAIEARLAEAAGARADAAGAVRAPLLVRYDRIRRGRTPVVLVPLRQDACGHCHTAVPLQRRQIILQGQTLESCEGCGVLLYVEE